MLNIPTDDILKKFTKKNTFLGEKLHKGRWEEICTIEEHELSRTIEQLHISGLYGIEKERRIYPFGESCAHVTGFVNHDGIPISGVERYMDFYLRGQDGFISSEKDGRRRELVQYRTQNINTCNGYDITLTVDAKIQELVYHQIQQLVNEYSPQSASIIVSDVNTGEILAIGNYPSYNPNNYGKFLLDLMRNRAVSDVYEPGSTFKIVSASLALEYGLVNDDTTFDCSQNTTTNRGVVVKLPKDYTAFDKLSYVDVFRKSSNRGAVLMALMLGEDKLYEGIKRFGYGNKTGYGFDSEVNGILYSLKNWDTMAITRIPMGHCIAVMPMQTNFAMSVIASNGLLLSPQLFKSISDKNSTLLRFHPKIRHRVLSKETATHVKNILNNPYYGKINGSVSYCGKSGTAQKIIDGKYSHDRHVASFTCFFPSENPRIVITVIVDDAKVKSGIAWGSRISLPVFKSLTKEIAQYLNL